MKKLLTIFFVFLCCNAAAQEMFVPFFSHHLTRKTFYSSSLYEKIDVGFQRAEIKYNSWNLGAIYSHKVGKVYLNIGSFINSYYDPAFILGSGIGGEVIRLDVFGAFGYPDKAITPFYFVTLRRGILSLSINHQIVLTGFYFKLSN